MSPLLTGPQNIRKNITELTTEPIQSDSRQKAIKTIAKKHGISFEEARFRQALAIAKSKANER